MQQRISLMLLSLLLFCSLSLAQDHPLRTFGEGQIPKLGSANGMMQDDRGVIWMWGTHGITSYDGSRFEHFSNRVGLPSNYIYNIRQAAQGELYFATYGGLVRYNPVTRHLCTIPILPSEPIRDVAFHEKGLFVATDKGVFFHDERGTFQIAVLLPDSSVALNFLVHQLAYDQKRDILWVATDRFGLTAVYPEKLWPLFELKTESPVESVHLCPTVFRGVVFFERDPIENYRLSDPEARLQLWSETSRVYAPNPPFWTWPTRGVTLSPSDGTAIVWDRAEVYRVEEDGRLSSIDPATPHSNLRSVNLLSNDHISIIRGSGLYLLDGNSIRKMSPLQGLSENEYQVHFQDRQGIQWILDRQGDLHRFVTRDITVYSSNHHPQLSNLQHVYELQDGTLLAASSSALSRVWGEQLEPVLNFERLEGEYVNLGVDQNGRYLIASSVRLYLFDPRTGNLRALTSTLPTNESRTRFVADSDGILWGILSGKLYCWDGASLTTKPVDPYLTSLSLHVAEDGGVFVGQWAWLQEYRYGFRRTYTELVLHQQPASFQPPGVTDPDREIVRPSNGFLTDSFSAVACATGQDSALWVGTFNAGIVRIVSNPSLQETADSLIVYDTRNGLPNNAVTGLSRGPEGELFFTLAHGAAIVSRAGLESIEMDLPHDAILHDFLRMANDRIIAATSHGLVVIEQERFYSFDHSSGLPENAVLSVRILQDGRILAKQPNGFYLVDIDRLMTSVLPGEPPFLSSVWVDSSHVGPVSDVTIASHRRSLRFEIALPDYFNENSHLFSWKLEGFDEEFRPFTRQSSFEYTNLPPGFFRLEVRAKNGLGEERSLAQPLQVRVLKRFHETSFFKALIVLFVVGIGYLVYRWHLKRLQARQEIELMVEREKVKAVSKLAVSVAHEFNNPLQVILGAWELNRTETINPERRQFHLNKIPGQVARMKKLIDYLLKLKEVREIDYAAGVTFLDIQLHEENDSESSGSGSGGQSSPHSSSPQKQ